MFTRRCSERRFFLRPDSTTSAVWYCLGWAAQKHGMVLHAAVAMSNHLHVVASDPRGVYPDFLRDFHGLLARVVNAWRGRWEHFWDANRASAVLREDEAAQLEKSPTSCATPSVSSRRRPLGRASPRCRPSSSASPSRPSARLTFSAMLTTAERCPTPSN